MKKANATGSSGKPAKKAPAKAATKKTASKPAAKKAVTKKTATKKQVAAAPAKAATPSEPAAPSKPAAPSEPAAPSKPAAPAAQPAVKKEAVPAVSVTSVVASIDVGFGNQLFIRGEGPGLSWERGVLMDCESSDTWVWSTKAASRPFSYKILINDEQWCSGEDFVANVGEKNVVVPTF